MFCSQCGTKLQEGSLFCGQCGAPVETVTNTSDEAKEQETAEKNVTDVTEETVEKAAEESVEEMKEEQVEETVEKPAEEPIEQVTEESYQTENTGTKGSANETGPGSTDKKIVLQIVSGFFALVFLIFFFKNGFGGLRDMFGLPRMFRWLGARALFSFLAYCLRIAQGLVYGAAVLVYVTVILKWEKKQTNNLFMVVAECGALGIAIGVLRLMLTFIYMLLQGGFYAKGFSYFIPILIWNLIAVAAIYGILFLMESQPFCGLTGDELKELAMEAPKEFLEMVKTLGDSIPKSEKTVQASNGGAQSTEVAVSQQVYNGVPVGGMLKTDRSLILWILLSVVTCGIYPYFGLHNIAKEVNIACEGDGQTTPGILEFILLSLVTCGIYAWIWYYKLANRLQVNAPRYGLMFAENGTTVLLWFLFGSLICGIGPIIALSIVIKNTNAICMAYNKANF